MPTATSSTSWPRNFVMGRGRIDGRPVVVGADDFTVRGGAADASIWEKQVVSEQMAGELGIPVVRLVDGTGGGGSVKTLRDDRLHLRAAQSRLGACGRQPRQGAGGGARPGLGRRAGLGAAGDVALFADGDRHLADVRRRSAGRGAARREGHQGGAGRHRDPCPQRRGRRRGRERGRGVRAHAAVPLLPALLDRRPAPTGSRATTIPTAARRR